MSKISIAFTGPSNSGKTTLIEKLSKLLIQELKKNVVIIKNDPKDKAIFDYEGKDSYKFSQTGADVFVTSPNRTTFLSKKHKNIDEMILMAGDFDYLLVEGLKTLPLPRIGIFRNQIDLDYISVIDALAIDDSIDIVDYEIPNTLKILNLNNPLEILNWINIHGKKF